MGTEPLGKLNSQGSDAAAAMDQHLPPGLKLRRLNCVPPAKAVRGIDAAPLNDSDVGINATREASTATYAA